MNLLSKNMRDYVQPTAMTKKLTLDGVTKAYPVYRVRLDQLFYNEQNDRIATWISQYKSEKGEDAFRSLTQAQYNDVIEEFIIQSNPTSIERTQMNIELVGQRESGVVLTDGRIIDGNRRFTCLRRLAESNLDYNWFETVILDEQLKSSRKQIKMLELAIQHGEEKKVDYNPLECMVGVYQDIIKTELLTPEEYAESTNEPLNEVKKRIEHAKFMAGFLEYIGLPEQYHIVREYQAVTIFTEMGGLLRRCKRESDRNILMKAIYTNLFMETISDGRKYLRNLTNMMENNIFSSYLKQQDVLNAQIEVELHEASPTSIEELRNFVYLHSDLTEELRNLMDNSIVKARKRAAKAKPSQSVTKSIAMLKDVDVKIFDVLNEEEKEKLSEKMDILSYKVSVIREKLEDGTSAEIPSDKPSEIIKTKKVVNSGERDKIKQCEYTIAVKHIDEPIVTCLDMDHKITNLIFLLHFRADTFAEYQKQECIYRMFFLNEEGKMISDIQEVLLKAGETEYVQFTLHSSSSNEKSCFLALQSMNDGEFELQQKIPFSIGISFAADFDF